jgi:Domain of Unknown Function (DUF748)
MNLAKISPRARRILWIAASLLALFTITGFFILPPIVKAQLVKRLSAELGRPVTVEKVRVNPYALSLTIENLNVGERTGDDAFFGWRRFYARFGALASLGGDWVLPAVALDGLHARVVINPDGTFNFSDLLAKFGAAAVGPAGAAPSKPSRPVRVGSLKITDTRVDFADHSRKKPFRTVVGPLSFALTEFRTAGNRGAPYHFEAVTEAGERFTWTGTLSADPLASTGDFGVENLDLPKYAPYTDQASRADITAGKLAVRGHYEAKIDAKNRVLTLADGGVSLRDLRVVERGSGQPAVELSALEVTGINADAVSMKTGIGRATLGGGHLTVRREKDGTINLLNLLPAGEAASGAPPAPAASVPPVDLTVGEVALRDFKIDVTDLAAPRPVQLGLSNLQGSLKNVSLAAGAVMPLQFSLAWAPQGTVQIEGSVSVKPAVKLTLKTEVAGLAILPLSPYLEQFANARITKGAVSTSNRVQFALEGTQPVATFEGDVRVDKFGLVDGAHLEDLAGFSSLALNGIKIGTTPQLSVALADVTVTEPYARVVVEKDKTLNLAAVANQSGAAPAGAKTGSNAPLPKIEIAKVTITGGEFSFTDRSLEPNANMAVNQFGGTIAGLSSGTLGRADVDLKAAIDGVGPVAIAGKLDPLSENKFADLTVDVKSVDLQPLSPYSGRFAGFELTRGKLFLAIKAKVADRKIDMSNVVTLDQFTFGAPTNSPDATALPVRLGVALLKDMDGKIVINVPVEGSLDDPTFRIGKVVWRVIANLLTKAAVSPFSLLGSMFGGGGEELAYQEFDPGSSILRPQEEGKLQTLVKALTNRPALSLDLEGNFDAAGDTYALKQQKFADLVRRKIWETRRAADPNLPPPEQLTITTEEHNATVKTLFDGRFPPGTEFGTPLPKPPPPAPPPPAPPPGFFKRVVSVVTFEKTRERRAEEKRKAQAAEELKKETAAAVAAGLPVEVMTARLAETMEVSPDDLRGLATQRAEQVRGYLLTVGKITPERLFMATRPAGASEQSHGPRVTLELR